MATVYIDEEAVACDTPEVCTPNDEEVLVRVGHVVTEMSMTEAIHLQADIRTRIAAVLGYVPEGV